LSLTAIRSLGFATTQQARAVADNLVREQLLEPLSATQFQVPEAVRQRFTQGETSPTEQVTAEVTAEVTEEVRRLLAVMSGEMKRADMQQAIGLKHEKHFRDAYLLPALAVGVIEMTHPDKPQSSKQRYRLTAQGKAVLGLKS
jgi:ATP-dependent DNA helicase RecG